MNPTLNPFEPGTAAALALFATRVGGAMLIAPVYSSRTIPVKIRVAILLVLTITVAPTLLAAGPAPAVGPATLGAELVIGFGLGLGAALLVGATQIAGDVLSFQMGVSGASTLDPLTQQQTTALSDLLTLMVVTLILTMDGHILILEGLTASVGVVPLGSGIAAQDGLYALASLGSDLFQTGLRIAAPVVAAVFISNLAMGVLARTAPQLQVFMLAYPLQIIVGSIVLAFSLPMMGVGVSSWPGEYRAFASDLLGTLGGR